MFKKLLESLKKKGFYFGYTIKFKAPKKTWAQKEKDK